MKTAEHILFTPYGEVRAWAVVEKDPELGRYFAGISVNYIWRHAKTGLTEPYDTSEFVARTAAESMARALAEEEDRLYQVANIAKLLSEQSQAEEEKCG